ncbi:Uncharacterized protein M832_08690 [Chlamydia avium 10DC88]|uniref:Uncharacterized protein n=2 Tax=Chlamydia avium TaxID=1457141 RepID=W8JSB5_9CHLA|nr:Uncharacterized protein M832_08690 [Chlamydia avium 10DC88]EPP38784.1 hypothetical protein CP10881SC42_0298 [Chlamydia avium]
MRIFLIYAKTQFLHKLLSIQKIGEELCIDAFVLDFLSVCFYL